MKILDRLRNRPQPAGDSPSGAGVSDEDRMPVPGYDRLDAKEVGARLRELSQVELAAVESYERSHRDRPTVLAKLRYMRTTEPLPDYDALRPEEIAEAVADTDAETVKAVRDYERKFRRRQDVLEETARVLPTSPASAAEDRSREEKATRLREGYEGRSKAADGLADGRSAPDDRDR